MNYEQKAALQDSNKARMYEERYKKRRKKKTNEMSNDYQKIKMEYQVQEILYDYSDKVINKKQLYEYLKTYGYNNKQIKELIK